MYSVHYTKHCCINIAYWWISSISNMERHFVDAVLFATMMNWNENNYCIIFGTCWTPPPFRPPIQTTYMYTIQILMIGNRWSMVGVGHFNIISIIIFNPKRYLTTIIHIRWWNLESSSANLFSANKKKKQIQ